MSTPAQHPRDAEAAEYVIGSGSLDERRAFERDMAADASLRAAVRDWEERLSGLAAALPPVEPGPETAIAVERSLDGRSAPNVASFPAASELARLRQSRAIWRAATAGAASLAAALAIYIAIDRAGPSDPGPGLVAVVNRSGDLPALLVRVDPARRTVQVRSVATETPAGHSLELWSVAGGGSPRSLGLIDAGATRRPLPAGAGALAEGVTLAVSVEPRGGSPTGAPTGPVVYSGRLLPETP